MDWSRTALRTLLGTRLPQTGGVLTVEGPDASLTIRRDGAHVPHVDAASPADAWYGLGFAQGQDRAFQVEALTRLAAGRLSALVGADTLAFDRLTRRIGFGHVARAQLAAVDGPARRTLEAFARGLTDGATVGSSQPAHEFALLRARPTPVAAADVLAVTALQAFLLAGNWEHELARLQVLVHDGAAALADLDPTYREHLPVTAPPGASSGPVVDAVRRDVTRLLDTLGRGASNNWVLAGSRTASGRPLLANDPHLPPLLPSPWYLAHLTCPEWSVAGACLVATPGFGAAHNGHGAWGATSAHTDNTDLFLHEVDGSRVRVGDEWVDCEVRTERIGVRGGEDEVVEVLETPHGPLIGPDVGDGRHDLSIRGTWASARPALGLLGAPAARGFDEFRELFRDWPGLQLNLVWADTSGSIGWQLVGELPRRRVGWGTVPADATDPEVGWHGEPVAFDDLPFARDPRLGLLATANNKPVADDQARAFLGVDWLEGYRAAAIVDALVGRDDWDVARTLRLQRDVRSLPWLEIAGAVLALPTEDPDARMALALLEAWDGHVRADSPAAAVYELFVAELACRLVAARAPVAGEWLLGRGASLVTAESLLTLRRTGHLTRLVREQPDGWFARPWTEELADVLGTVVRRLRAERGERVADWAWGWLRPVTLRHLLSEEAPAALAAVFDRGPYPLGGDAHTIPQASVPPRDPTGQPVAVPSLRMVVDVGDWEACRWVLAGGQSGNPLSPHYDDQLAEWLAGQALPIPWSPSAVAAATTDTLRLLPAARAPTDTQETDRR